LSFFGAGIDLPVNSAMIVLGFNLFKNESVLVRTDLVPVVIIVIIRDEYPDPY
jgi:hypothetical protein